jgi:hypothetical protein
VKRLANGILAVCSLALWILSLGIYVFSLYVAYLTSFGATILTFMFPGPAQVYWIWAVWQETGVFLNPYTIMCLVWLGLAAVAIACFKVAG